MAFKFVAGQKVIYRKDGKTYDFGYVSDVGKYVLYEEGECNMQDSFWAEPEDVTPQRVCILCGKPRLIPRNAGQFNDGDDFCSDECYNKFGEETDPILSKFINDITVNQKDALTTLINHEHHHILINMLVEQLEFMILMGGGPKT